MSVKAPAWVNVVLEGGGLTLERALVAYRQLARHLEGDWRPHARAVQALARQIVGHETEVHEVEERAVRRSTLSKMAEIEKLARAVLAAEVGKHAKSGFRAA